MKSPVPGFLVKYRKSKFFAFIAGDYIYISYMSKGRSTHQKSPTEPPQLVKVKVLRRIIIYMLCHSKHKNSSIYRLVTSVDLSVGLHSAIRDLPFRKTGEARVLYVEPLLAIAINYRAEECTTVQNSISSLLWFNHQIPVYNESQMSSKQVMSPSDRPSDTLLS